MIASQSAAMNSVQWSAGGVPLNLQFGEAYRSRSGALAQARTVFLQGCGLPERWRGAVDFALLELGFGLGLNFLATWAAWAADPQRSGSLHYRAIEAWPVAADDLQRSSGAAVRESRRAAVAGLGEVTPANPWAAQDDSIEPLTQQLALHWPMLRPGLQTWTLSGAGAPPVYLTLAVGDVSEMLTALAGQPPAQAIYLDGFSPAVNPAMWSPPVLQGVAACCAAEARLASYSTAPAVREGLAAAGFEVWRRSGLPPKRHRLEARRQAVV